MSIASAGAALEWSRVFGEAPSPGSVSLGLLLPGFADRLGHDGTLSSIFFASTLSFPFLSTSTQHLPS